MNGINCRWIVAGIVMVLALVSGTPGADAPGKTPADDSALYERIVKLYLDGQWEELETDLAAKATALAKLPKEQAADVAYIKQAVADGRPAWWKAVKAGKKTPLKVTVWGKTITTAFDPAGKSNVQTNVTNGVITQTMTWKPDEMDNPAGAEHGFSKGELTHLGIWQIFGSAEVMLSVPIETQSRLNEAERLLLNRYTDLRSEAAGIYYSSPRARRWGLWLACAGYMDKYAKVQTIQGRKSIGAMLMAEVLGHPERYPSIKLPKDVPAENAEEKLADFLKNWMEKHAVTLAEDKSLREAIKSFAASNSEKGWKAGQAILPNGLTMALDPAADKGPREKREAWVKEQWAKVK